MAGKQLAPQQALQQPSRPVVSTVPEAILNFCASVADVAEDVWGAAEAGLSPAKAAVPPDPTATGGAVQVPQQAPQQAVQNGQAASGAAQDSAAQAAEFATQDPEVRVAHLYTQLGATDAFLNAVYADATLYEAASKLQTPDWFIGLFAAATVSAGVAQKAPALLAAQLDAVIDGLTVGSDMTLDVRTGLRKLLDGMAAAQAMRAFGKRFNHGMLNTTGTWTLPVITAVWDQLALLPDADVTELTVLTTFNAIQGAGGFGPSWEAPTVVNTIQLGEANSPAHMGHTVRHEIGHAVHAEMPATINSWLQNEIGFWFLSDDDTGYTQWITELGGFASTYTDAAGDEQAFGDAEKAKVVALLDSYVGGGSSWSAARATMTDGVDATDALLWSAMPQNVQDAVVNSPSHWYQNYSSFSAGTKGTYFLNYWYARPFWMSAAAKAVVDSTGRAYTAMSEKEFFADAYAEYFKDPAGYADETKWGGNLPAGVKNFFQAQIVDRQPYTPPAPAAAGATAADAGTTAGGTPPKATGMPGTP